MVRWLPVTALCLTLILAGCADVHRTVFADQSPQAVWTAMVGAAEAPIYDDWTVLENQVWRSPDAARLEVYRELARQLRNPDRSWSTEHRQWRFQVILESEAPPTAAFTSHTKTFPPRVSAEAQRYFATVREYLAVGAPDQLDQRGIEEDAGGAESTAPVDVEALEPDRQ